MGYQGFEVSNYRIHVPYMNEDAINEFKHITDFELLEYGAKSHNFW